jgi:hypothetical protein
MDVRLVRLHDGERLDNGRYSQEQEEEQRARVEDHKDGCTQLYFFIKKFMFNGQRIVLGEVLGELTR